MGIGKSIGSAFMSPLRSLNAGFHAGVGDFSLLGKMPIITTGTVLGGMAGGALGVAGGDEVNTVGTAAAGAAIGTIGLPLLGATAGLSAAGAITLGRNMGAIADTVGGAAISGFKYTGKLGAAALQGVNISGGSTAFGQTAARLTSGALSPVRGLMGMYETLASKAVEWSPGAIRYNKKTGAIRRGRPLRIKPLGHGILFGAAAIGGLNRARQTFETSRMGEVDRYITRATPRMPSYYDNAGASGDLVFALNQNRRG